MERTTDMTKGHPRKLLLKFAFPLILTNLGQQFYMIADGAIVGRGVGVKALAAVGSADWCYWLILWTVTGLTQAFATFISRYFGEKNYRDMNKTIAMSTILCLITGIILTIFGIVLAKPILKLLSTPDDIIGGATTYLITMISGTMIVTAYNMSSAILRALGNGKAPLIAMIISAVLNIGLDLIFVMVFNLGIFGAAFASVLSQLFSFIYCFCCLRKIHFIKLDKEMWKTDFKMIKELLGFGVPIALQHIVISVGGIVLQSTINLYGSIFVAGFTAVNKLYGLLESTAISLGSAFSTFFAQNYGAGYKDRVRQGMKTGIKLCVVSAIIVMAVVFTSGKNLIKIFLDISKEGGIEAFEIGWKYLSYMSYFLIILYLIHIYRNVLQAMGTSVWSMISGIAELFVRAFMGKAFVLWFGVETLFFIEPAAWIGALLLVIIPYYCLQNKLLGNIIT